MDFKERHKKYCKVVNCPVCKKLDNMPPRAKGDLPKLLVKLPPDGNPKALPKYLIASTERLWNLASETQRKEALKHCVDQESTFMIEVLTKAIWSNLPSYTLRKKINQTSIVDRILAGMTEEEWNDFRKKHIILSRESSNLYRDDN